MAELGQKKRPRIQNLSFTTSSNGLPMNPTGPPFTLTFCQTIEGGKIKCKFNRDEGYRCRQLLGRQSLKLWSLGSVRGRAVAGFGAGLRTALANRNPGRRYSTWRLMAARMPWSLSSKTRHPQEGHQGGKLPQDRDRARFRRRTSAFAAEQRVEEVQEPGFAQKRGCDGGLAVGHDGGAKPVLTSFAQGLRRLGSHVRPLPVRSLPKRCPGPRGEGPDALRSRVQKR